MATLDPTLIAAANQGLESAINRALKYDPATQQRLSTLQGKSLAVHFAEFDITLTIAVQEAGVALKNFAESPTTHLSGTLPDLFRLATSGSSTLAGSGVSLQGDSELLGNLLDIVRDLDIDWEDAISHWIGDIPAHEVALGIRKQFDWLVNRQRNISRLFTEFITEEFGITPSRNEFEHRVEDILELRREADRLTAKINAFAQRALATPNKD